MIVAQWRDRFGFVKARQGQNDSGNGILYTAMYYVIKYACGDQPSLESIERLNFQGLIIRCTIEPGLYKRNPEGSYGQETWDDYLGIITWCIVFGEVEIAREIFWYGIRHAGFFVTDGKRTWDAFLWRSVPLFFGLLPVAAFPWLAKPMRPLLWLFSKFFNADTPKIYLDWLWFYGVSFTGFKPAKLATLTHALADSLIFEEDELNPTVMFAKELRA